MDEENLTGEENWEWKGRTWKEWIRTILQQGIKKWERERWSYVTCHCSLFIALVLPWPAHLCCSLANSDPPWPVTCLERLSVSISVSPPLLRIGVGVVYFLAPGWHSKSWLHQSQPPVRAKTYWLASVSLINWIYLKISVNMFMFWGKQFLFLVWFIRDPESFSLNL